MTSGGDNDPVLCVDYDGDTERVCRISRFAFAWSSFQVMSITYDNSGLQNDTLPVVRCTDYPIDVNYEYIKGKTDDANVVDNMYLWVNDEPFIYLNSRWPTGRYGPEKWPPKDNYPRTYGDEDPGFTGIGPYDPESPRLTFREYHGFDFVGTPTLLFSRLPNPGTYGMRNNAAEDVKALAGFARKAGNCKSYYVDMVDHHDTRYIHYMDIRTANKKFAVYTKHIKSTVLQDITGDPSEPFETRGSIEENRYQLCLWDEENEDTGTYDGLQIEADVKFEERCEEIVDSWEGQTIDRAGPLLSGGMNPHWTYETHWKRQEAPLNGDTLNYIRPWYYHKHASVGSATYKGKWDNYTAENYPYFEGTEYMAPNVTQLMSATGWEVFKEVAGVWTSTLTYPDRHTHDSPEEFKVTGGFGIDDYRNKAVYLQYLKNGSTTHYHCLKVKGKMDGNMNTLAGAGEWFHPIGTV